MDLTRKLGEVRDYYDAHRVHRSLDGTTPARRAGRNRPLLLPRLIVTLGDNIAAVCSRLHLPLDWKFATHRHSTCANQIDVLPLKPYRSHVHIHIINMITAAQLKAARALLGMDQRALAEASGLSLPTIQRMEASEDVIRGQVESLMKLIAALETAGVEFINEGAISGSGGRGVRLKPH
jgi:DNA-binding transcriptional regulator YiaG